MRRSAALAIELGVDDSRHRGGVEPGAEERVYIRDVRRRVGDHVVVADVEDTEVRLRADPLLHLRNVPLEQRRHLLVRDLVGSLAAAMSEERDAIEEIYEPFLIQIGFLDRTPRGRVATARAYEYFGLAAPGKDRLW